MTEFGWKGSVQGQFTDVVRHFLCGNDVLLWVGGKALQEHQRLLAIGVGTVSLFLAAAKLHQQVACKLVG
jgi:hypothetical protein